MAIRAERDLTLNLHERRHGNAMLSAANDLDKLSRGADATGDRMLAMSRDAKVLELQIEKTQARIKDLGTQFARTGDQSLFGDLRKERNFLRQLQQIAKDAGDVAGDVSVDLGKAPASMGLRGPAIGALVGVAAAAAPAIGAILSGALAGTVGTGALAAGLLSAAKSPEVKTAANQFGEAISTEFFRGGDAFVDPAIRSLDILEGAFKDMEVPDALAKMAPLAEVIADGFGDLGKNLMPGFNTALDRMAPFAVVAADGLSDTGDALSEFLDDVTESEGSLEGLRYLFMLLNGTIRTIGSSLQGLSDIFHGTATVGAELSGRLEDVFNWGSKLGSFGLVDTSPYGEFWERINNDLERILRNAPGVGAALRDGAEGVEVFGEAASAADVATTAFNDALDETYTTMRGLVDAEIKAEGAFDRLTEALQENGVSFDVTTEAGREQLNFLGDYADGALLAAQQTYAQTGSMEQAQATFERYRDQLVQMLIQMGMNEDAARALVDQYLAMANLPDIYKTVNVKYSYTSPVGVPPQWILDERMKADGGPVQAGKGYIVGEEGPEWFQPGQNGTIIPNDALASARGWAGGGMGGGGGTTTVVIDVTGGDEDLKRLIRKWVRIDGPEVIGIPSSN